MDLAPRHLLATLSDHRVVPILKLGYKAVGVSCLRGRSDVVLGYVGNIRGTKEISGVRRECQGYENNIRGMKGISRVRREYPGYEENIRGT